MIRLLHIPERYCVLLHPVTNCHSKKGFRMFDDVDKAEECARLLLEYQDKREKWLYSSLGIGKDPHLFISNENYRAKCDAVVGRRIMDRI